MKKRLIGFVAMTVAVLAPLLTSAEAQMSSITSPGKNNSSDESVKPRTRQVIASASGAAIRFACLGELIQMRLEVIGSSGEVLFDSDFKSANLIDWSASDKQGQKLVDGVYLCVVTVKDSSGQITQTHGTASLKDQSVSLSRSDSSLMTSAQVEAAGRLAGEDSGFTILEPGQSQSSAVLAQDGSAAHLVSGSGGLSIGTGDFFANKVLEHIRLTAEGNVGIGTNNPQARLDVDGRIRASQGIVFPDGSIQFSAARKTYGAASAKPGEFGDHSIEGQSETSGITPSIAGTGTTGKIPKWQDGPNGILTDSAITELNGSIGINGAPDPTYKLDVLGHNRFRGSNVSFYLTGTKVGGNEWLFQTVDADGRLRIFENSTGGGERFSLSQNGNVGIGTANPVGLLHVRGASPVRILGDVSTLAGAEYVDFMARNSPFSSDMGGMRIQRQPASGDIDTLLLATASGNSASEKMRVRGNGNVGIGTASAGSKLTVAGVIESTSGGLKFPDGSVQTTAATGGGGLTHDSTLTGNGTSGSPLGVAFPLSASGSSANPMVSISNSDSGIGVQGTGAVGVYGFSTGGLGVRGVSTDGWGVRGDSTNGYGVRGFSTTNDGVQGSGVNGVQGFGNDAGVKGTSANGFGVAGYTTSGTGVYGDNGNSNTTGHAGYFNGRVNITGNLFANNLAGARFNQQHTTSGNTIPFGGAVVDAVTIVAPDRGVLFISAFVNLVTAANGQMQHDFVLDDGGSAVLTQTTEEGQSSSGLKVQRTAHLSWMLRVEAGQSVTVRTVVRVGPSGWVSTQFYDHNLSVVYLRNEY